MRGMKICDAAMLATHLCVNMGVSLIDASTVNALSCWPAAGPLLATPSCCDSYTNDGW
jgi:hypothetical protein